MNYISVQVLRHAAAVMAAIESHEGVSLPCQWQDSPESEFCGRPAEYLSPDATRVSLGGDIEHGPQWFCKEHLELELGKPVGNQSLFSRIENPGPMPPSE
jgi:hypothetical protein